MIAKQTISLDGVELNIWRGGEGRPLVYLHGASGLSESSSFLNILSKSYDVIAPEHPGFGGTICPDWIDDVSDLAYLYLDLVLALGISGARLVGHSLGGWISLEMLVRDGAHFDDLTLIASAGIHVPGSLKTDIFMIDPDEQARLAFANPEMAEHAARTALAEKYQDSAITDRIASARFGWNPRFYNPRLGRWLGRVRIPTLIVWGAQDRIFAPGHGPALQHLIPNSRLAVIQDCGHFPQIEKPDDLLREMGAA